MYKIDIKNFYRNIYTHVFTKLKKQNGSIDKYIRLYNNDKTNSLLLGNILSTLAANEIMEDICEELKIKLDGMKIEYFSDQLYIFYNNNSDSNQILDIVKKTIGKSYFEFEVNENDTKIYNHEELIKMRDFRKKQDYLYKIQNIEYDDKKFYEDHDYDYSNEKLKYYFNSLIDNYYKIEESKRKTFVEVALKRTFSFSINLCRLEIILNENNDISEQIIEVLFMFLNKHPELILLYIKIGIWYIIENSKIYINNKIFYKYKKKFYNNMLAFLDKLNSIYYFHIYYLLENKFKNITVKEKFIKEFNNSIKGKNKLLDSIIAASFNVKINLKETKNIVFNDENWLYNYTVYVNSHYYQKEQDEISKAAFKAKKLKIKIIKNLDEIVVSNSIIRKINENRKMLNNW